ncbi:hypothetical protein KCU98_g11798, partial [Aureobasidium melanogenum]
MNDLLIENMKKYTDMSDEEVDEFAYYLVATDYLKLPDHRGGAIIPGTKHYRSDGAEHTLADVPHRVVVQEIENQIQKQPEDRRTEMYRKVVEGVQGAKKNPDWERPAINPNKDPATPFSASKAVCAIPPLEPFKDVPNHFVRDSIMDYINSEVEEDKKETARTAVFSDLNPSEIAAYSAFVSKSKDEERRKETEEEERLEEIMNIMDTHKPKPKSILEAMNIIQQKELLDKISDDDLDLRQRGNYGHFDTDFEGVFKSVVKPGSRKLPYEAETACPLVIDLNCDQIRAYWLWGQIARPELKKFLEKRGEDEGETLRVRALCWQFFKSREVLGLDMTKSSQDDIKKIQEKGKKRASGDDDQTPGKKPKPSTAERLDAARLSAMGVQRVPSDGGDSTPGRTATPIDLTED